MVKKIFEKITVVKIISISLSLLLFATMPLQVFASTHKIQDSSLDIMPNEINTLSDSLAFYESLGSTTEVVFEDDNRYICNVTIPVGDKVVESNIQASIDSNGNQTIKIKEGNLSDTLIITPSGEIIENGVPVKVGDVQTKYYLHKTKGFQVTSRMSTRKHVVTGYYEENCRGYIKGSSETFWQVFSY